MLFVFGRLFVSGSAMALGPPRDLTCTLARKNLRDVPGLVVLTHSALLWNLSLLWDSVPKTSYSISSIFMFLYLIFSLNTSPPVPHSIHCCILTSICCFAGISWLVFVFRLGLLGPIFTNGLPPYVSYSFISFTGVRYSQVESNIRPKAIISIYYFFFADWPPSIETESSAWFVLLFSPTLAVCWDRKQHAGHDPSARIFIWSRC